MRMPAVKSGSTEFIPLAHDRDRPSRCQTRSNLREARSILGDDQGIANEKSDEVNKAPQTFDATNMPLVIVMHTARSLSLQLWSLASIFATQAMPPSFSSFQTPLCLRNEKLGSQKKIRTIQFLA